MNLYLMRHAHALDVGEKGVRTDRDRPLSRKGMEITHEVASALKTLGVQVDCVATSPYPRALQTAEIVARELGEAPLDRCPMLEPGASPTEVTQWLRGSTLHSVMLVGHMPDLAEIASLLICGTPTAGLMFKKAAVCRITFAASPAPGTGTLEWLLPPALLAKLD
jgi:phosphohistidine phosphatase